MPKLKKEINRLRQIGPWIVLALFMAGCDVQPPAGPAATLTSMPVPVPTATGTAVPVTEPSGPMAGQWEGDSQVAFRVTADGQLRDFHIEIEIPISGVCTVDIESVDVTPEGTFRFQFGDTDVEDANVIQGKFESQSSVSGTFSQALFCVDSQTGQGVMSFAAEGIWSAQWTAP